MAKIVKSNLQLEALKFVNDGIKLIEKINRMLKETDVEKCALNIKINNGRISLDDYDFSIKVLHSLKRDTFNKIKKRCAKFSIELDEKDKEILGIIEKEIEAEMEQGLEAVETEAVEDVEASEEREDVAETTEVSEVPEEESETEVQDLSESEVEYEQEQEQESDEAEGDSGYGEGEGSDEGESDLSDEALSNMYF